MDDDWEITLKGWEIALLVDALNAQQTVDMFYDGNDHSIKTVLEKFNKNYTEDQQAKVLEKMQAFETTFLI